MNSQINYIDFSINNIQLNNINIQVKIKYFKNKKTKEINKEWFTNNLSFHYEKKKYNLSEITIIFDHIDKDNPEFFLQPEQIIKVTKSKLIIKEEKYFLIIEKFQQLSEEERKKFFLKK
jgi:neutral trehalase